MAEGAERRPAGSNLFRRKGIRSYDIWRRHRKHIECARSRRAPHVKLYAAAKATLLSLTETRRSSHLGRLGMNPDDYRTKWNLPRNYPMVAPNYSGSVPHIASNTQ
ncbi:MucR family transcriptional regulator [Mesorhizobium sp. LSHC412B00]|uniref:MucR family transcriptional regulator n=1 Tax=Mesorhizobium sp. LSHC412B00 TaxID=1287285 RepID=UPI0035930F59